MGMSAAAALHAADNVPTIWERGAMNRVVTDFMQEHQAPGMSVAVADHGDLVHERAYGLADRRAIVPALERSMTGAAGRPANAVDAASLRWLQGESTKLTRAL